MIPHHKFPVMLSLLLVTSLILSACKTETIIETVEVPVEVEVEKPVQVEVLITPTPIPIPQGGYVVQATSFEPSSLNPILPGNTDFDQNVRGKLFLNFLDNDPLTGEIVGEIAESWSTSEDGLTYTFKLRRDIFWTDSTPVTAKDVKFTFDALRSVDTYHRSTYIDLIESTNVIDDYTLEIAFHTPNCSGLEDLAVGILPSHMYAEDFSDILESPLNEKPTVTNGPLKFQEWVKSDHITLVRNEDYYLSAPNIDGLIYRIIGDLTTDLAVFLAGESDITFVQNEYVSIIEGEIALGRPFKIQKYFDRGYYLAAFNMANPENPESGWEDANENGEFDENEASNLLQEPHPILGDKLVRQAIAYAVDYTSIINKVAYGQGVPIAANVRPDIKWAYNWDLEPYTYDPEMAATLLDQAGWLPEGEDGIRMKDGVSLSLHILTYPWIIYEEIAVMMKDNLENLGFEITLDILDWGTVLESALGQRFDILISKWSNMPSDPDDSQFWAYRFDIPGSGKNFVSYYNEEVENLLFEANTLPGCSTQERGDLYKRIQKLIHEDAPYAFIYNPLYIDAWTTRLVGYDPKTWNWNYNVHEWYLEPEAP